MTTGNHRNGTGFYIIVPDGFICETCGAPMLETPNVTLGFTNSATNRRVEIVMDRALVCQGCGFKTFHGYDFDEWRDKVTAAEAKR